MIFILKILVSKKMENIYIVKMIYLKLNVEIKLNFFLF